MISTSTEAAEADWGKQQTAQKQKYSMRRNKTLYFSRFIFHCPPVVN
jgi:hypothetical protein